MGFFFSQKKYIQYLLDQSSLTDHWIVETPIEHNVHLQATNGELLIELQNFTLNCVFGASDKEDHINSWKIWYDW
jgi:hypothetical protein